MEGEIRKGVGGFYSVKGTDGALYTLRAQAKLRRRRLTPLVGDHVTFTVGRDEENSWLLDILPRKSCIARPAVANVDKLVLTVSAGIPKADLLLLDRLLLVCRKSGVSALVVVNKADQDPASAQEIACQYRGAAEGVYVVSAQSGEGVEALREALWGTMHAFGGQSGVGKSTLINRLYGLRLETGSLSDRIERGRHTTRHTELIEVEGGGRVLDTPGFSLLESELIEPMALSALYPEFLPFEGECRFTPCAHDKEPDCAVKAAVEDGRIHRARHERYCMLYEEMHQKWRERYD